MAPHTSGMPEELRRTIAADPESVRPLPAPWKRVLWALPVAVVIVAVPLLVFGLRAGTEELGPLLSWVPMVLQVALGLALLTLALREAVPGLGIPRTLVFTVCLGALGAHLAVNLVVWLRYPVGYQDLLESWWGCFRYEFLLAVPFLVLVTWLAAAALPVRPRAVGLLAGAGAGFLADASWRMICPVSAPLHVIGAHDGAIVFLGALGYLLGWFWEKRQASRYGRRANGG